MNAKHVWVTLLAAVLSGTVFAAPDSKAPPPPTMQQKINALDKQGLTTAGLAAELDKLEQTARTPDEKLAIYSRFLTYYTPAYYGRHLKNVYCDEDKDAPTCRILVNGQTAFEGPTLLPDCDWGTQKIAIPASMLNKDGTNRLEIVNLEEGFGTQTPPFIAIVYAVIQGKT